jgi:hypothetical protein
MTPRERATLKYFAERLRRLADVLEHGEQGFEDAKLILEESMTPHFDCIDATHSEVAAVCRLYAVLSEG